MLRTVLLLWLAAAGALRTRETVQRVVMLRTSGSDLAPAASGYVCSQRDDGPERVRRMGESEVQRQLARRRVIPVQEPVDGAADVDYQKLFDDYSAPYGDRYLGGSHRELGAGAEDDGAADQRRFGQGDGTYHNAKYESYSITEGHDGRDDGDEPHGLEDHWDHFGKAFPDEHRHYGARARGPERPAAELEASAGEPAAAGPAPHEAAGPAPLEAAGPAPLEAADEAPGGRGRGYGYEINH